MKPFALFTRKFLTFSAPERAIREACAEAIKEVVGISVDEKYISVQRDIIVLQVPSTLRSEVALEKDAIVAALNKKLEPSKRRIMDVR